MKRFAALIRLTAYLALAGFCFNLPAFARETGLPLSAAVVQQTGGPSEGLERDWPPLVSGADTNYSYAFQWFSLCALMGGLFIWFQVVRPLRSNRRRRSGP